MKRGNARRKGEEKTNRERREGKKVRKSGKKRLETDLVVRKDIFILSLTEQEKIDTERGKERETRKLKNEEEGE